MKSKNSTPGQVCQGSYLYMGRLVKLSCRNGISGWLHETSCPGLTRRLSLARLRLSQNHTKQASLNLAGTVLLRWLFSLVSHVCESCETTINQSIDRSISQPVSQSVSQSISQSVSQSVSPSVCQAISQSVSPSLCSSVCQSVCPSVSESVSQKI